MPKLRVIIKPPPEPQGDAEQQTEALRDYLLQMSEELAYVLTHLEADNINDSTFERIQSMIPRPYTGLPVMDGDASSGQSEQWARGNHRHPHDTSKADVTALEAEAAAREAHEADTDNPHGVTAAQAGAIPDTATLDDISDGTTYAKTTATQVEQIGTNETDIDTIEGKIPSAASTSNQLADKAFVTDSITQGTAIFRGSFATKAALLAVAWQTSDPDAPYYVSNNDYAVVLDDETQNDECWRYIYVTGTGWTPQYRINESPLTQAQLDALNSGATAAIINSVADKLDKTGDGKDVTATFTAASTRANISTGEKLSVLFGKIAKWFSDLGTAAFRAATGSITSGSTDLVESGAVYTGLAGKQNKITASGILKGDGQGGVSAATAGTDYGTYSKPSGGIPASDLANGVIPTVPFAYTSNPAMDGTASPGSSGAWAKGDHVHPSDTTKANQAQLATVESGSTASRAYAVREYFCWNGLLYRVTSAISSGDTFTPGTNCESTTVGDEFGNLYTIDGTSVSATANTDTTISITAPSGYQYGVFFGFSASSDYTKITLITIAAQGATYPNRIRFRSTVAQTVTAKVLWFK